MIRRNSDVRPVLLVGGGTGGHIFPLVAIGEELERQKIPFIFAGSPKSKEEEIVSRLGWKFVPISAGKWRRYFTLKSFWQNILDVGRSISGVFQAIRLIKKTNVKLVFSKGGFVALPVVLAAKLTGCKIIIHESDAVMGATNKISSRFATRVLTAFSPKVFSFSDQRFVQVGIPIRRALRQAAELKAPKKSRPILLILPASQGAVAINQYLKVTLRQLLALADIVHMTGEKDYESFIELRNSLNPKEQKSYKPYRFIERELPYYFQTADLLIARSSATTTAEAALFKKATYLIPLPSAAGNHQVVNARILDRFGAAVVKEQYQLTPEIFLRDVEDLLRDPERLRSLGQKLNDYFNEADSVAKVLEEIKNAQS